MTLVHSFMPCPDAHKPTAKALAELFAPGQDALWEAPYSETGAAPATWWISSGYIGAEFEALLGKPQETFDAYQALGGTAVTLAQIEALYLATPLGTHIRSDAEWREQECIAELGLRAVTEEA